LNFQTEDTAMSLNQALFADNGFCGYVLKPDILLDSSLNFNPLDTKTMRNKQNFELRIISAHKLPRRNEKDISDPLVIISLYGVPADMSEKRTKSIKDNGFNPIWNENFRFAVNCPELAFVKFTVKDENLGKDQVLGSYTIRFSSIRPGYRHIRLFNKESKGSLFVGVRITPLKSLTELIDQDFYN
jgi:Ca2+-dependent lipid-binding protein